MVNRSLHHCLYCWAAITPRASGRPRRICGSQACRRAADAERRRIQRRRAAGLQTVTRRVAEPVERGGRDPLIRRLAKQLAREIWPGVPASREDLDAVIEAMRNGLDTSWRLRDATANGHLAGLSASAQDGLERLHARAASIQKIAEEEETREAYAKAGLSVDPSTGSWVRRR